MEIGEKIKVQREKQQFTQKELSEKLHVARSTVSSWEVGRTYPDIEILIQLSELFSVSFDYLLGQDIDYLKAIDKEIKEGREVKTKFKKWVISLLVLLTLFILFVLYQYITARSNPLVTGGYLFIKRDFYVIVFLSFLCGAIIAGIVSLLISKQNMVESK